MSTRSFKTLPVVLALLLTMGALSACNTVRGLGQDAQAAGRGIVNTAEDVQDDL